MCQSDYENDLLFLLTLERLPVMQPTNKLNKSSVKLGAWVSHAAGWLLLFASVADGTVDPWVPFCCVSSLVSNSKDFTAPLPPAPPSSSSFLISLICL